MSGISSKKKNVVETRVVESRNSPHLRPGFYDAVVNDMMPIISALWQGVFCCFFFIFSVKYLARAAFNCPELKAGQQSNLMDLSCFIN